MKARPLADRVIVRPEKAAAKSQGGIHLPEGSREKPQKGEVLAVGPGRYSEHSDHLIPVAVKVGQVVLFTRWSGTEIKELEDCVILSESDILAILE